MSLISEYVIVVYHCRGHFVIVDDQVLTCAGGPHRLSVQRMPQAMRERPSRASTMIVPMLNSEIAASSFLLRLTFLPRESSSSLVMGYLSIISQE